MAGCARPTAPVPVVVIEATLKHHGMGQEAERLLVRLTEDGDDRKVPINRVIGEVGTTRSCLDLVQPRISSYPQGKNSNNSQFREKY